MKFITPCFVRVENSDARKELTEWLKGIGYHVCSCCLFDGWHTLHCDLIERLEAHYEVHGIPDYDKDTGYNVGWFKADNADKVHPSYDCGENIALFKALAAMNKNNWDEQYVIDNAGNIGLCNVIPDASGIQCRCVTMMGLSFNIDNYRKATAEEIVEHFKNK
ncbi:hypothetical protein [Alistipes putredinis]|uniref:hypothetical protein n=1 Tax=Alistipes putredinis TaxID=28117 RepID=UPI003AF188EE